jgi:hypothetical protein
VTTVWGCSADAATPFSASWHPWSPTDLGHSDPPYFVAQQTSGAASSGASTAPRLGSPTWTTADIRVARVLVGFLVLCLTRSLRLWMNVGSRTALRKLDYGVPKFVRSDAMPRRCSVGLLQGNMAFVIDPTADQPSESARAQVWRSQ